MNLPPKPILKTDLKYWATKPFPYWLARTTCANRQGGRLEPGDFSGFLPD